MSETSELFKTIFVTVEKKMRDFKRTVVKDCKNNVAKVKDIAEDKVRLLKSHHCQDSDLVRRKNRVEEEKQAEKRAAVTEAEIVEETASNLKIDPEIVEESEISLSPSAQELRTNLTNQAKNEDVPELSPSEINNSHMEHLNNRNKQKLTVPEIYDEVINSIKDETENNKIFIFHGRGKTKIDNVVRLLKKDGLKVKKFTGAENDTAVDVKHTEAGAGETLTNQMEAFANSLKNEVGVFYLDARVGYGALNVHQVLNNSKNIVMLVLTDDEVFTEELKEYSFFEYSF